MHIFSQFNVCDIAISKIVLLEITEVICRLNMILTTIKLTFFFGMHAYVHIFSPKLSRPHVDYVKYAINQIVFARDYRGDLL